MHKTYQVDLIINLHVFVFIPGGIESDSPLQVRHGAPLKIRCSSTNKPTLAKLEWIFTDVNNKSKIIGKHGKKLLLYFFYGMD